MVGVSPKNWIEFGLGVQVKVHRRWNVLLMDGPDTMEGMTDRECCVKH